nr:hypothetical protein [Geoalkalibacter sp.]
MAHARESIALFYQPIENPIPNQTGYRSGNAGGMRIILQIFLNQAASSGDDSWDRGGPTLEFLVEPLQRIGGMQLHPMGRRKTETGQHIAKTRKKRDRPKRPTP